RQDCITECTDRFDFFIGALVVANGFSELNDDEDQPERFRKPVEAAASGDDAARPYDTDALRARAAGRPPTAGPGLGRGRRGRS
ncbi:lysine--tRNA ligase, partial [Francisella tularensis subsp. holarctica]|uniref:amino acid--tRNA ligase-related protein n=1 Tax=Francisella tularensis TaxID=263 RepID=UPI0023AC8709|nr:lysine--tRNA ligase [Francisella tularensis subsp. holarctica]